MSAYEIDNDVPVPTTRSKYPFDEMEVGDSFFVSGGSKLTLRKMRSASNWATKKFPDTKYSVRAVENGVRIWRVA